MPNVKVKIEIKFSWWLILYLKSLIFFCSLTGFEPDEDKLFKAVSLGTRRKVKLA